MNADPATPAHLSPEVRDAMASGWMKRGIALLNENTPATLARSLPCFERAIALRSSLPLRDSPWYRHLLAGGWMNRGDALTRLAGEENLAEAVRSYDQALALLQTLELADDLRFRKRRALAWMNRGVTLQQQATNSSLREALSSFDEAMSLLRDPAAMEDADLRSILACNLMNRGNALLLIEPSMPILSRAAAKEALALVAGSEAEDLSAAETGFKARHLFCRAIAAELAVNDAASPSQDLIAAATDVVDDALKQVRSWEARGERRFRDLATELFRFGARVYLLHQPHFLTEFLLENLDRRHSADAFPPDSKMHSAACEAIDSAVAEILRAGFRWINTHRFLEQLRDLRITQKRLSELSAAV